MAKSCKMIDLIPDEILIHEIAPIVRRLRASRTPEQREIMFTNALKQYAKTGQPIPEYLAITTEQESLANLAYYKEFWEASGILFHALDSQAFVDLRAGVVEWYRKQEKS